VGGRVLRGWRGGVGMREEEERLGRLADATWGEGAKYR
jgi:hypothetical protein